MSGAQNEADQQLGDGKLNKAGGYTAAVYFSSDLVPAGEAMANEKYTGIPAVGCDGGGCVEVFATAEDAESRNSYLANFDGNALLAPGSHEVLGTCVVRTSDKITASQQQTLTQNIKDSLTRL